MENHSASQQNQGTKFAWKVAIKTVCTYVTKDRQTDRVGETQPSLLLKVDMWTCALINAQERSSKVIQSAQYINAIRHAFFQCSVTVGQLAGRASGL